MTVYDGTSELSSDGDELDVWNISMAEMQMVSGSYRASASDR